jgi:hypothetical protein
MTPDYHLMASYTLAEFGDMVLRHRGDLRITTSYRQFNVCCTGM